MISLLRYGEPYSYTVLTSTVHNLYIEYHSVCPLVGLGAAPLPRLWARGWGSSNSDDWRKSLALCPLCGYAIQA